jgi:flagellar basal body-associated protein FliL
MTTLELARRVKAVRDAQKAYFRDRTGEDLEESKRLERELDKIVKEILDDKPALLPFGE